MEKDYLHEVYLKDETDMLIAECIYLHIAFEW